MYFHEILPPPSYINAVDEHFGHKYSPYNADIYDNFVERLIKPYLNKNNSKIQKDFVEKFRYFHTLPFIKVALTLPELFSDNSADLIDEANAMFDMFSRLKVKDYGWRTAFQYVVDYDLDSRSALYFLYLDRKKRSAMVKLSYIYKREEEEKEREYVKGEKRSKRKSKEEQGPVRRAHNIRWRVGDIISRKKVRKIGEILQDEGLLSKKEVAEALKTQKSIRRKEKKPLGKILLEKGLIDEKDLQKCLSIQKNDEKKRKYRDFSNDRIGFVTWPDECDQNYAENYRDPVTGTLFDLRKRLAGESFEGLTIEQRIDKILEKAFPVPLSKEDIVKIIKEKENLGWKVIPSSGLDKEDNEKEKFEDSITHDITKEGPQKTPLEEAEENLDSQQKRKKMEEFFESLKRRQQEILKEWHILCERSPKDPPVRELVERIKIDMSGETARKDKIEIGIKLFRCIGGRGYNYSNNDQLLDYLAEIIEDFIQKENKNDTL